MAGIQIYAEKNTKKASVKNAHKNSEKNKETAVSGTYQLQVSFFCAVYNMVCFLALPKQIFAIEFLCCAVLKKRHFYAKTAICLLFSLLLCAFFTLAIVRIKNLLR